MASLPLLAIFLCSLLVVSGHGSSESRSCAQLYVQENTQGIAFSFADQQQSVELARDQRASRTGWSATGSIAVESGCKLQACNEVYLDGVCKILEEGSYSIQDNSFISNISSARCSCEKTCSCSDVHIKSTKCGSAYFTGGCKTCNTLYTNLETGKWETFPSKFMNSVEAFRVRSNCSLTIYSEEDFEGDEQLIETEILEDFQGSVGSYQCSCSDEIHNDTSPTVPLPLKTDQIRIPVSIDQLVEMLENSNNKNHQGLLSSLKSYKNGRSPKNFYILLLGSTGAGKSTTINLLFDNPNVTQAGDVVSTTSDIHEFRIPVTVDDLGIGNAEIRVIDTPGLGDTRGIAHDAQFLAGLEDYLTNHEELKSRIPNLVLIFHKFADNRFQGVGSNFVKMIRGLDMFRERITDDNYSNVVFVFSHFCSVTSTVSRRPEKRLDLFRNVIESYSRFPQPIHIAVAENKGAENELPMKDNSFKLPNNEYYPQNLVEQLLLITEKGGDPIGNAVLKTAFGKSFQTFNVSSTTFDILNTENDRTAKFLSTLASTNTETVNTQVTEVLERVWEAEVDESMQVEYSSSFENLKAHLFLHNIITEKDVPRTSQGIFELLSTIKLNEATALVLEKGLNISVPAFPEKILVGSGYNLNQDAVLSSSPFDLGELQQSEIGFLMPAHVVCKPKLQSLEQFETFGNKEAYMQHRLKSFQVNDSITSVNFFTDSVKPGFYINKSTEGISSVKDFQLFELSLDQDEITLNLEFENAVKNLQPFNESDFANVVQWKTFFETYGTHVVTLVNGGGSMQLKLDSKNMPFDNVSKSMVFATMNQLEGLVIEEETSGVSNEKLKTFKETFKPEVLLFGGNPAQRVINVDKSSRVENYNMLKAWKRSIHSNPVILTTQLMLWPISQVVQKLGQNYTEEVERAAKLFLTFKLTYVPSILKELRTQLHEANSKFQNLSLTLQQERWNWEQNYTEIKRQNDEAITKIGIKHKEALISKDSTCDYNQRLLKNGHESEKQSLRRDCDRRQTENSNWYWRQINDNRYRCEQDLAYARRRQGGCLKAGTLITMADLSEKPVEELKVGDEVLDVELRPTKVLGVVHEFMFHQKFLGFSKNQFFFTRNHIFVGEPEVKPNFRRLFAASTSALYLNNPLIEYLNVTEFRNARDVKLLRLKRDGNSVSLLSHHFQNVFEDTEDYPEDALMYDIQVDSPTGTYFANGYVCRHEVPPVEHWPNTMSLLFTLFRRSLIFEKLGHNYQYTISNAKLLDKVTEKVADQVKARLPTMYSEIAGLSQNAKNYIESGLQTLEGNNVMELISKIFSSPNLSTVAVGLYARTGKAVAYYLDSQTKEIHLSKRQIAMLQEKFLELFSAELETQFSKVL